MSMFDLDPNLSQQVKEGIEKDGCNLTGVSGYCSWKESSNISLLSLLRNILRLGIITFLLLQINFNEFLFIGLFINFYILNVHYIFLCTSPELY